MHNIELAIAVGVVLLGLRLIAIAYWPRPRMTSAAHVHLELPRPRVDARRLVLAHRGVARLLRSSYRPRAADFALFERYTRDVDVTYVSSIAFATPGVIWIRAGVNAAAPLLELEQLLEQLEHFTARVRRWRPGRRDERG